MAEGRGVRGSRFFWIAALAGSTVLNAHAAVAATPHLVPRPAQIDVDAGCRGPSLGRGVTAPAGLEAAAREIVDERWRALGIPTLITAEPARLGRTSLRSNLSITIAHRESAPQGYRLTVDAHVIRIESADDAGTFYALTTLAQLPQHMPDGYRLPCVHIADAPALRWRILADDISRGPLPTMRYFKERIRTIAAFKMNGYSPNMEHVFVDLNHPLPAPLDGLTAGELRELDAYARRFHIALIPEQQTFAHMHNTLRWERYAPLAELPHGYLLSPAQPGSVTYIRDLIRDEFAAVPKPPFFHIGSDEPSDLGRGQTKALVDSEGEGPVYVRHVVDTAKLVQTLGARPMLWDDALARHPELFAQLPKSLVFINWHYGNESTFVPYIKRIAAGGFEQMVSPGANNWDEIFPDLDRALANEDRFITEGKAAGVLGLYQTVWHDDGETLFEATWYPVLYAAASAWERVPVERSRFAADFPATFFGVDDPRYAADIAQLASARTLLRPSGEGDSSDALFWADPFEPRLLARIQARVDLAAVRRAAESAIEHLRLAPDPPLHANAARVMHLAARRYDLLARNFQIAKEARDYYDDGRANADGKHDNFVYRGLFISRYLLWEQRDAFLELEPLVRAAWTYENRSSHGLSVFERYHAAAQTAIARADRIRAATYEGYVQQRTLPTFDEALGLVPLAK